ncbi:hypothetical protein WJX73_010308 [Symbiochloris irregularis]|uniref:Uncharacterized protein n=1 Tax=Symbiochloris irregularis TaxID=706552 RepID=A0AAW1Q481_9CHLO
MADEPRGLAWRSRDDQLVWLKSVWPSMPQAELTTYRDLLWDTGLLTTLAVAELDIDALYSMIASREQAAVLRVSDKGSQPTPVEGHQFETPLDSWDDIEEDSWSWAQSDEHRGRTDEGEYEDANDRRLEANNLPA